MPPAARRGGPPLSPGLDHGALGAAFRPVGDDYATALRELDALGLPARDRARLAQKRRGCYARALRQLLRSVERTSAAEPPTEPEA